jgi:hypothetical protein
LLRELRTCKFSPSAPLFLLDKSFPLHGPHNLCQGCEIGGYYSTGIRILAEWMKVNIPVFGLQGLKGLGFNIDPESILMLKVLIYNQEVEPVTTENLINIYRIKG